MHTIELQVNGRAVSVTFRLARMDELGYVRESLSHPENTAFPRDETIRSSTGRFKAQKALLNQLEGAPALMERYLQALAHEYYGFDGKESAEAVLAEAITAGGLDGMFELPAGQFLFFSEKVELLNLAGEGGIWDIDAGEWGRLREEEQARQLRERMALIGDFL